MPVNSSRLNKTYNRKFPSELDGQALVHNRLYAARLDFQWRRRKTDMKEAERLYKGEGKDDTLDSEGKIPRVNKIERATDDLVTVALDNVPNVQMVSTRDVATEENPLAQAVLVEAIEDTEKTTNGYIREILRDNRWQDQSDRATKQAGIYGVGYVKIDLDDSMDTRRTKEAQRLMQKPMTEWSDAEWNLYEILSKRIDVNWIDSRDVAMQHGHRRYDEDMLRISMIERASTRALRTQYNNQDIKPGKFPFFIDEDPNGEGDITGVITTWELEPVYVTKTISRGGQQVETKFTGWQLVKTVIAGGQLIEKEVSDPMDGVTSLPIVPIYIKEAETHPYGDPIPLKLKYSEMFLNLMRLIIYKSAKNSASTTGVLVDANALTEHDQQRVQRIMNDGGLAAIEGNNQGAKSLEDIVVPVNHTNTTLSRAPIEAMQNEERVFQDISQSLDIEAINRAESGAGKRAQMMAQDRAKGISIGNLHRSIRMVYDRVYEFISVHHSEDNVPVVVQETDGSRRRIKLNQPVRDRVPKVTRDGKVQMNPKLKSQDNPLGLVEQTIEYRLNDTTLNMRAEVEGRGDLPTDPTARFNMLLMWLQAGLITEETFRELQLTPWIKAKDNKNRERKRQEKQKQMQEMIARQQGQEPPARAQRSPESREDPMTGGGSDVPGAVEGEGEGDHPGGQVGSNTGSGMLALQNEMGGAEGSSGQGVQPQEKARDQAQANPQLQQLIQQLQ